MADQSPSTLWLMRALYIVVCGAVVFVYLLPLDIAPRGWAGPDLMLAVTFAWALRKPEYVPMVSVAIVFVLADFLFQRPPGLLAALALLGTEWLKSRERRQRIISFAVEWATVTAAVFGIFLLYRLVLKVVIIPPGPLSLALMQSIMTALIYPLAVAVTRIGFGVRRIQRGDTDIMGQRS